MKDIYIAITSFGKLSKAGFGAGGLAKKLNVDSNTIDDEKMITVDDEIYSVYKLSFDDWVNEMKALEVNSILEISKDILFGYEYQIPIMSIFNKLEICRDKEGWDDLLGLGNKYYDDDISDIDLDSIIQEG